MANKEVLEVVMDESMTEVPIDEIQEGTPTGLKTGLIILGGTVVTGGVVYLGMKLGKVIKKKFYDYKRKKALECPEVSENDVKEEVENE